MNSLDWCEDIVAGCGLGLLVDGEGKYSSQSDAGKTRGVSLASQRHGESISTFL